MACSERGVLRARRFRGRLLRRSALVGTDSGPGSDILVGFVEGGLFVEVVEVVIAAREKVHEDRSDVTRVREEGYKKMALVILT